VLQNAASVLNTSFDPLLSLAGASASRAEVDVAIDEGPDNDDTGSDSLFYDGRAFDDPTVATPSPEKLASKTSAKHPMRKSDCLCNGEELQCRFALISDCRMWYEKLTNAW